MKHGSLAFLSISNNEVEHHGKHENHLLYFCHMFIFLSFEFKRRHIRVLFLHSVLMSLPIHIFIAYNSRVLRQRFAKYILQPFKLISNCIEKCCSSDPTESGSPVPETILIMLSQTTVEPCGRCIKTVYWNQYNTTYMQTTLIHTGYIIHLLHSEY